MYEVERYARGLAAKKAGLRELGPAADYQGLKLSDEQWTPFIADARSVIRDRNTRDSAVWDLRNDSALDG